MSPIPVSKNKVVGTAPHYTARHSATSRRLETTLRFAEKASAAAAALVAAADLVVSHARVREWFALYFLLFIVFLIGRAAATYAVRRKASRRQQATVGIAAAVIAAATELYAGIPGVTLPAHAMLLVAECLVVLAVAFGNRDFVSVARARSRAG